jgi:hypothetical protein
MHARTTSHARFRPSVARTLHGSADRPKNIPPFPTRPPVNPGITGHRVAVSHLDMVTVADLSSLTKRTIIAAQPTVGCPCISPGGAKLVDRTILQLEDPNHARPLLTNTRGADPTSRDPDRRTANDAQRRSLTGPEAHR